MKQILKLFDDTPYISHPQIRISANESITSLATFNETRKRKLTYQNINLTYNLNYVGKNELPEVKPYIGAIPKILTPYSMKRNGDKSGAIHFFIDDYHFVGMYLWGHLNRFTRGLSEYQSIIAPDYSIYLDQSRTLNLFQIYQNRVVTAIWQQMGLNVIPSVSWGNADSFEYCFDALPQQSVIAIGGMGNGHHKSMTELWEYGVRLTIERLHPVALIIYGAPKRLELPVSTYYFESYIHTKLRRL